MNPYLYTQSEVLAILRTLLMEPTAERWTDAQIYSCMSIALQGWQGRVRVPYIYNITGGWVSGTYDYTLPDYVDKRTVQPQAKVSGWDSIEGIITSGSETWADIQAFTVEPNETGGFVLRLSYSNPRSSLIGASSEGRAIWWGQQLQVPAVATLPILSAGISSTDTSLTLTTQPVIGRVGYVKINSEWVGYSGYTESGATLTLTNLVRGLNGTTAATHSTSDTVTWGVGMDTPALLNALYDGTRVYLMQMWLSNPSSRETASYEKQLVLYQTNLDRFWKGYTPSRSLRSRLSRMAIGDNI